MITKRKSITKANKTRKYGGGFLSNITSIFKKNNNTNNVPISQNPKTNIVQSMSDKSTKITNPLLKINNTIEKIDKTTENISDISSSVKNITGLNAISQTDVIINPIHSIAHHIAEIVKIHPIGSLLIGTLLFVKKLQELYKNHQTMVIFLTQVSSIIENSYRLNELIDKINEIMVIYTFNNQDYQDNYNTLLLLEQDSLTNTNVESETKEKTLFNELLTSANDKKNSFRSSVKQIEFNNLDKFIEPDIEIKKQLTLRIAEINKYLLTIATNDMLASLKNDISIQKSGLVNLVLNEIKSRDKRFKWLRNKKRDWDRANSMGPVMRKLNDDLIMMNSLFILVKFQMDFTMDYYKNQNIPSAEWNKLWKLITSFREYTFYMIPNDVFLTIQNITDALSNETSKVAVELLAGIVDDIKDEENNTIQMETLNQQPEISEQNEPMFAETAFGGKKTRRVKNRRKYKKYKSSISKRV